MRTSVSVREQASVTASSRSGNRAAAQATINRILRRGPDEPNALRLRALLRAQDGEFADDQMLGTRPRNSTRVSASGGGSSHDLAASSRPPFWLGRRRCRAPSASTVCFLRPVLHGHAARRPSCGEWPAAGRGVGLSQDPEGRSEPHALVESADIDPELTESWTTLGTLQAWGLNQADAVGSFRRALAINPDAARVMLSLGHVHKALGNTADSVHGQDAE